MILWYWKGQSLFVFIWFLTFWIFGTCFHSMSPILSTSKAYPTIQSQEFSACTTMLISPRIREKQSFCLTISCWLRSVLCSVACMIISWNAGVFWTPPIYTKNQRECCVFRFAKPDEAKKINSAFHVSLSTWNYKTVLNNLMDIIFSWYHIDTFLPSKILNGVSSFNKIEMYSLLILTIFYQIRSECETHSLFNIGCMKSDIMSDCISCADWCSKILKNFARWSFVTYTKYLIHCIFKRIFKMLYCFFIGFINHETYLYM